MIHPYVCVCVYVCANQNSFDIVQAQIIHVTMWVKCTTMHSHSHKAIVELTYKVMKNEKDF